MIGKHGSGWQTTTADLALILFLVVSASSAQSGPAPGRSERAAPTTAAPALEPIPSTAVYRATEGTTLPQWLASQSIDDRQIVTVIVKRAAAGPSPAMKQGIAFLDQIQSSGRTGRLLVEPDTSDDVAVVLAYDGGAGSGMALAAR